MHWYGGNDASDNHTNAFAALRNRVRFCVLSFDRSRQISTKSNQTNSHTLTPNELNEINEKKKNKLNLNEMHHTIAQATHSIGTSTVLLVSSALHSVPFSYRIASLIYFFLLHFFSLSSVILSVAKQTHFLTSIAFFPSLLENVSDFSFSPNVNAIGRVL